ncbi:MAG TPA: hypothetical protein PL001_05750, partial [Candidatus Kryptobacter bacterium]|nr:hypothetical protein [Candidatus Kryptobacter bacterium]
RTHLRHIIKKLGGLMKKKYMKCFTGLFAFTLIIAGIPYSPLSILRSSEPERNLTPISLNLKY